jgi:Sec-independent protein translocase protein TatA
MFGIWLYLAFGSADLRSELTGEWQLHDNAGTSVYSVELHLCGKELCGSFWRDTGEAGKIADALISQFELKLEGKGHGKVVSAKEDGALITAFRYNVQNEGNPTLPGSTWKLQKPASVIKFEDKDSGSVQFGRDTYILKRVAQVASEYSFWSNKTNQIVIGIGLMVVIQIIFRLLKGGNKVTDAKTQEKEILGQKKKDDDYNERKSDEANNENAEKNEAEEEKKQEAEEFPSGGEAPSADNTHSDFSISASASASASGSASGSASASGSGSGSGDSDSDGEDGDSDGDSDSGGN